MWIQFARYEYSVDSVTSSKSGAKFVGSLQRIVIRLGASSGFSTDMKTLKFTP